MCECICMYEDSVFICCFSAVSDSDQNLIIYQYQPEGKVCVWEICVCKWFSWLFLWYIPAHLVFNHVFSACSVTSHFVSSSWKQWWEVLNPTRRHQYWVSREHHFQTSLPVLCSSRITSWNARPHAGPKTHYLLWYVLCTLGYYGSCRAEKLLVPIIIAGLKLLTCLIIASFLTTLYSYAHLEQYTTFSLIEVSSLCWVQISGGWLQDCAMSKYTIAAAVVIIMYCYCSHPRWLPGLSAPSSWDNVPSSENAADQTCTRPST